MPVVEAAVKARIKMRRIKFKGGKLVHGKKLSLLHKKNNLPELCKIGNVVRERYIVV